MAVAGRGRRICLGVGAPVCMDTWYLDGGGENESDRLFSRCNGWLRTPRFRGTSATVSSVDEQDDSALGQPDDADAGAELDDDPRAEASIPELLEALARELTALAGIEARTAAARHQPELRRAARGVGAVLVVAIALLAAVVLTSAAAVMGLATVIPGWAAALVLAGAWSAVATVLAFFLLTRARRVATTVVQDADAAREEALGAIGDTLEELMAAGAGAVAAAAVPMALDVTSGVIDAGEDLLEDADDLVEDLVENMPGGGAINQIWDVALLPGRLSFRVATAVLRLGDGNNERADDDN